MREKTCHISVLTNRTSAKTISSGTARDRTATDAASCSKRRGPVHLMIPTRP